MKHFIKFGDENQAIGSVWDIECANNKEAMLVETRKCIELLHPLNSSLEGAEEYRNRFRGRHIYLRGVDGKYTLIGKLTK